MRRSGAAQRFPAYCKREDFASMKDDVDIPKRVDVVVRDALISERCSERDNRQQAATGNVQQAVGKPRVVVCDARL